MNSTQSPLRQDGLSAPERANLLEQSVWSFSFERKDLLDLAEFLKGYSASKGDVICNEGDGESFMAIIIRGRLAVFKSAPDGTQPLVGHLGADKSFGEMSVVDREPRSAKVIADTDVRLLVMSRQEFDRLLDAQPRLACKFLTRIARLLSQRLRQTTGQLAEHLAERLA
jgi:CRP-like cAMP-binding protein